MNPYTLGGSRNSVAGDTFRYFAYGSNMLSRRLRAKERDPSAARIGTGFVKGRRLTFDKVSQDGSGKCDAEQTGVATDRVYGVLFETAKFEKKALDDAEGLGRGYREEYIEIDTPKGRFNAITYIAISKEPRIRPYHWYKALVVAGAVEHGLPGDYVEWIGAFESQEDLKAERRAKNEALLSRRHFALSPAAQLGRWSDGVRNGVRG